MWSVRRRSSLLRFRCVRCNDLQGRGGEERRGVSGIATGCAATKLVGGTANHIPFWLRANVALDTWESVLEIGYTYAKVDDCI